ncbi:MAG: sulfatase-like hydrolase/transferase [Thermogutta sp.]
MGKHVFQALLASLVFGFAAQNSGLCDEQHAARPNIVWLTSEDNAACWYRLYHPAGAPMPNIERLAREGLVFNNVYSCSPVCSPARSTIISGCYVPRLGAHWHRKILPVKLPSGLHMFPWYLRQAGYYTTNNSKEDYNFAPSEKVGTWDESSPRATYRNRKPGQPFFHVQNFGGTHESQLFPDRQNDQLLTDPASVTLFPYHPDTPLFRNKYAHYLDLHRQLDTQIGAFIEQLEKDGLLEETFIFHFGDNGGVLPGSKGYAREDGLHVALVVYVPHKWQHLVPAPRGSRINGIVEFVDLGPTVLNLAGLPIPSQMDGRPFLGPGVTLETLEKRDTAFGYADRFDEKYDLVRFLRKGKFTYWRSYQPFNFDGLYNEYRYKQAAYRQWWDLFQKGQLNVTQRAFFEPRPPECLFDLEKNPHETHNLAGDPAYAEVLLDMRRTLQERVKALPDLGFIPEPVFVKESGGDGAAYAEKNKVRIARLVDIADLQLLPFDQARTHLEQALISNDPLERYWAVITCTAFGTQAGILVDMIRHLAERDENALVRTRAAEFLGWTGLRDPRPILIDVLKKTTDPVEANLILNTVVLLRDGQPRLPFDLSPLREAPWITAHGEVSRRVNYLFGEGK